MSTSSQESSISSPDKKSLSSRSCTPPPRPLVPRNSYDNNANSPIDDSRIPTLIVPESLVEPSKTCDSESIEDIEIKSLAPDHGYQESGPQVQNTRHVSNKAINKTVSAAPYRSFVVQEKEGMRWDSGLELQKVSKDIHIMQKWFIIIGMTATNALFIWLAWHFQHEYYVWIPLLSSTTFIQSIMVIFISLTFLWQSLRDRFWPVTEKSPEKPERLIMLLPCYNETREDLEKSLNSLVSQNHLQEHPKLIFIIVDGDVKGRGMEKTTQEYLLHDILPCEERRNFSNGYTARDGLFMPCVVQHGFYKGIPYLLVAKRHNQGKRDSLCFARSFLYHFRHNSRAHPTMFNPELFDYLGSVMLLHGLDDVDYLSGMDADTIFDDNCIWEMILALRRGGDRLVGVCGHVCVKNDVSPWALGNLYQATEYTLTQGLRRTFQSMITGKVNCLPGCCQLLRVDESTFGDEVLRVQFGFVPKPNDNITSHILGNYSEDSLHASVIFSVFPAKLTAQALRAKAFTEVPQSLSVFLSQRKRWSLGSISNEFRLIFRPGIVILERLQSIAIVITWWIMPFIIAAYVGMVILIVEHLREVIRNSLLLGFWAVLLIRYVFSFCMVFWLPRNSKERWQFLAGFCIHFFVSPVVNLVITVYSIANINDFKWGKTREVEEEETVGLDNCEKRPSVL